MSDRDQKQDDQINPESQGEKVAPQPSEIKDADLEKTAGGGSYYEEGYPNDGV